MSGLKLRGRAVTVAAIAAVILPFGVMAASSASAATDPLGTVTGLLGSATGGSIASPVDTVTGLVGGSGLPLDSVTGLVGGSGLPTDAVSGVLANPTSAVDTATGLVGGTGLPTDAVTGLVGGVTGGSVTGIVPGAVGTVTGLVPGAVGTVTGLVPAVTETVGGIVGSVPGLVNGVVGGINTNLPTTKTTHKAPTKAVKSAHKAHVDTREVETSALPHTGGDANATALLMCAGLAIAGTGVTLVTRRRNGLALHAAR
jgi:hypothetical protein